MKLAPGDFVQLKSGERLRVAPLPLTPCGMIGRRDVLYRFVGSELTLTGRELALNLPEPKA